MSATASDLARVLEQALHAQVLLRCRRALLHEIRNGLQPLHAGLEALNRVAGMTPFPADKAQRYLQLVRQASTAQELALDRAIERIAPEQVAQQAVDVAALLREVTRFLSSDAAVAGVRLQLDVPPTVFVQARPDQLRLIALSLTLDAIDHAVPDGQLTISVHAMESSVLVQFSDTRPVAAPIEDDAWNLAPESLRAGGGFHLHVIRLIVEQLHGEADCMGGPGLGYTVAITLPLVEAPAGATLST
jgi:signal transduction histidine kinase